MLIDNGKVYLISNNLNVKYTGIDGKDDYNDTIMDGELIYIKENNRCEIVTTYYSAMADLQAKIWGGLLGDLQKPSKKEFGTYK